MELSNEGKKYLEKCKRIDLLRVISDFKVGRLKSDDQMALDLATPVAYFFVTSAIDMKEVHDNINIFTHHLIYVTQKLCDNPEGFIEFVEQLYKSRETKREYL